MDAVINMLTLWAESNDSVRAMLLTSSRAKLDASVDDLSDFDVLLIVSDITPFHTDRSWIKDFGRVLVAYWDPVQGVPEVPEFSMVGSVVQYENDYHIDFIVWPIGIIQQIVAAQNLPDGLDDGYRVLLDKDGLADSLPAPTCTAYIPKKPTEAEYLQCIEYFFSDIPYVAKCLWRDELAPAKWCLDYDMKYNFLFKMLEWWIAHQHDWAIAVGVNGRGLKKHLPQKYWAKLEATYCGADIDSNWDALFSSITFFRQVAIEVGQYLEYTYPHALDKGVTAHTERVRAKSH
ncbi:MAG: aminoglycoside 6-adenylyltransferase [Anaerolineae bacterium]|nr:aminoglycoside 6-adenylyltransferase [Anaerolineae bacterium]